MNQIDRDLANALTNALTAVTPQIRARALNCGGPENLVEIGGRRGEKCRLEALVRGAIRKEAEGKRWSVPGGDRYHRIGLWPVAHQVDVLIHGEHDSVIAAAEFKWLGQRHRWGPQIDNALHDALLLAAAHAREDVVLPHGYLITGVPESCAESPPGASGQVKERRRQTLRLLGGDGRYSVSDLLDGNDKWPELFFAEDEWSVDAPLPNLAAEIETIVTQRIGKPIAVPAVTGEDDWVLQCARVMSVAGEEAKRPDS